MQRIGNTEEVLMHSPDTLPKVQNILEDLDQDVSEKDLEAQDLYAQADALLEKAREAEAQAQGVRVQRDGTAGLFGLPLKYVSVETGSPAVDSSGSGYVSPQEMTSIRNRSEIARLMAQRHPEGWIRPLDACRQMHAAGVITTDPSNASKALARTLRKSGEWRDLERGKLLYIGSRRGPVSGIPVPVTNTRPPSDEDELEQGVPTFDDVQHLVHTPEQG